jgi:predicted flap endonuclease-1-like 5' DNA nuclease
MSLLFTIVYAAHANGTHHKLALDALRHLPRADAEPWRRVFLKHVEVYLAGSKAPDTEFKDFKNHVLHVRDGYWGGAPEKVASWYCHVVEALQEKDFERAVYAAGVLSHYYTDPVHPFHTAQSEAENNVHRAVEWSINRAYDALRAEGEARHQDETVTLPSGDDWLKAHVLAAAERSNPSYETLITHYDLRTGVVDPPAGLDPVARDAVAALLMYAAKGFALLLDRAITQSGAEPPEVSLTAETVLATLKVPAKWVTKKIGDAETRRQVQAMYDELMATGRVEVNLPEDDRMVRDLHKVEVLEPRARALAAERSKRLAAQGVATKPAPSAAAPKPAALAGPKDQGQVQPSRAIRPPMPASASSPEPSTGFEPAVQPASETKTTPLAVETVPESAAPPQTLAHHGALASLKTEPRCYLLEGDDLERAPSIGPKLAERLALTGIVSVADFLAADSESVAANLGDSRFNSDTIERWKKEARLVMSVPGLRGTHAQLLVGAGYETAEAVALADPIELSSALLSFATTPAGTRILRNGDAPDVEAVTRWVRFAQQALAA